MTMSFSIMPIMAIRRYCYCHTFERIAEAVQYLLAGDYIPKMPEGGLFA